MNNLYKIKKKYISDIITPWWSDYIHFSVLKKFLQDIIDNWYEILWYDGIIVDKNWTLWPISLIFDFSRKEASKKKKNILALKNINTLYDEAKKEGYNLDNLYVDVVIK